MANELIKPKKSWMKYLLIVSLGFNLLIVGLVVGAKIGGYGHKGGHHADGSGLRVLMRSLPDSKRGEVRQYFRDNRDKMRANGDAMGASLDTIGAAISVQPFDSEALNEAFVGQRAHIAVITQDAQKAFVAIIASMTDAERTKFVENMKERRHKWEKRRKDKKKYK